MTTDCTEIHELIPAYCLGATDPDETRLVAAHLAQCPDATVEAAEYRRLSQALLFSAPAAAPPAGLTNKLLAATTTTATTATAEPARPVAAAAAQAQPHDSSLSRWQQLRAALAGSGLRPLPVLAAIALVALVAINLYLFNQVGLLRGSFDELTGQLGKQTAVLTQVGEGTNVRIGLPPGPAGVATAAYGALVCNPQEPVGFLLAENMPPLAPGEAYQVWLGQGDTMVSAGLFEVDAEGYGRIVFSAPLPMGQYDSLRVTAEPATGSAQPTSAPAIGGSLYGAEYHS